MEWISLEKEKPDPFIDILFTDGKEIYKGWLESYELVEETSFYNDVSYVRSDKWPENITHWMPLPQAPKQ